MLPGGCLDLEDKRKSIRKKKNQSQWHCQAKTDLDNYRTFLNMNKVDTEHIKVARNLSTKL